MGIVRARIRLISTLVLVAFTMGSGVALAQSYDPDQDLPKPTLWEKRLNKFGRGVSNVLFGWAEIPLTFDRKMKEGKPLAYLLAAAPIVGAAKALVRTGVGIKEVLTFGKTSAEVNYEAILEPEYVF